jgi:hypothetical protein
MPDVTFTDDVQVVGLPFKPGDWAVDPCGERVAKVVRVYRCGEDVLLDLSIYSHKGERLGRTSPAMGGPTKTEPACDAKNWERIAEPDFPITIKWVPSSDGKVSARYWAGDRLPPANYVPRPKKPKAKPATRRSDFPATLDKEEYQHLVELFAGANDPIAISIVTKAQGMLDWYTKIGL